MKLNLASLISLSALATSSAFAPKAFVASNRNVAAFMAEDPVPFFATKDEGKGDSTSAAASAPEQTLEEEVEEMTQKEMKKMRRASNLRNEKGVDYAPWMNISAEDEAQIRQVMKERAEARRRRQEQERTVSGNLLVDSQAQELSGGGLNFKIIDTEAVELEWATSQEGNTKGFLVKRRPARTDDFEVIGSFEDWGPLLSKGPEGGVYRFLDETVTPGGWVYRITECEMDGKENDICQTLVEVQTPEEQRGAVIAAASIGTLVIAALAAGILLDPVGGY